MKSIISTLLLSACSTIPSKESVQTSVVNITKDAAAASAASNTMLYSYAGAFLFVLGALTSAFWDRKSGLILIVCGIASGTVPYIVTSTYFAWISALTLLSVASIGVWYLRWKAMHEVKEEEEKDA